MTRTTLVAIGCAAALTPLALRADTFSDTDSYFNYPPVTTSAPLTGAFDFRVGGDPSDGFGPDALGYNPATQQVVGVSLSFQVSSDLQNQQNIKVTLDNLVLNTFFVGSLTFGGTLSPADTATLIAAAQDGHVNIKFESKDATTTYNVLNGFMEITTAAKTSGGGKVPDAGSTSALLGLALGGFGLMGRKLRK